MFPTGLETKGWKQKWSYLSWSPTDPLGRICIPVPVTLYSVRLEVLVLRRGMNAPTK